MLDLHWSRDSKVLFSASADMHLASWDVETGERIRRHPGHEEVVNCMDVSKRGEEMLVSGSDDGYIGVSLPIQVLWGTSNTETDMGYTNERRRNLHPHRFPHNRNMLSGSRQRAFHRRHRQRHQGLGPAETGRHIHTAWSHRHSNLAATVTGQPDPTIERTRFNSEDMGCSAICTCRPPHPNL